MIKVIKIGGNVIDDTSSLNSFLEEFSQIKGKKILIHGGGKIASELSKKMGITPNMINGRRITDKETLDIVTMTYAGLVNKKIVAHLQSKNCNALGLSGADANVINSKKRAITDNIDFGFVGDIHDKSVNNDFITNLLQMGITPVLCAITHDKKGQLLNTNADTIASSIAVSLSRIEHTELYYCFEKNGVLLDINDDDSVVESIDFEHYTNLKNDHIIHDGMIPKMENSFHAIEKGVRKVIICNYKNFNNTLAKKTTLCQ